VRGTTRNGLRGGLILITVAALAAAVTGAGAGGAAGDPGGAQGPDTSHVAAPHHGKGSVDNRPGATAPTAGQRDALTRNGARVAWNRFGTPERLAPAADAASLAAGLDGDAEAVARSYLAVNRAALGLTADAVSSLQTVAVNRLGPGAAVLLRQQFGDLPAGYDGQVAIGVVHGTVVSLTSTLARDVSTPAPATLSPADAVRAALRDAGVSQDADLSAQGAHAGWQRFSAAGTDGVQSVQPVAVPMPDGGARSAYMVAVSDESAANPVNNTTYVDARTGDVLVREDNVDEENDDPTWKAFPENPPADYSSTDTRELWCWTATTGCDRVVANPSSPLPWDIDPSVSSTDSTHTTRGNNEYAAQAWDNSRGTGFNMTGFATPSPTRDYTYAWTNQWHDTSCSPSAFDSPQHNDIDAADTNLHAMHNRMHDFAYKLGFTESAWNMQVDNFGKSGLANDPEQGNSQSGARVTTSLIRDNANQSTGPDGTKPTTNMYLWQPVAGSFYSPCVDGDYDMSVIGHEYTHAISNRMVAGPNSGLQGPQAGAMGESWSDLNATEYLIENGLVPQGQDPFVTGQYVTGNATVGIRDYAISRNPLNYSDVGFDLTGPEVHADGEIWNGINYAVRQALVGRYGAGSAALNASCAAGETPVDQCPGGRRWIQLVYDSFLLMAQGRVSFIDARDAMLAADQVRFGGADVDLLWKAFARTGLGAGAASNTNADSDPTPSFDDPVGPDAQIRFQPVRDAIGAPVQVFVGHYQARSVPVADTDPATALPDTATMALGTYDLVVRGAGFGLSRQTITISDTKPRTIPLILNRNLASAANGATAAGDGVNQAKLIDDDEATDWAVLGAQAAPVAGTGVTVDLAGGAQQVRRVEVSALLRAQDTQDPGGDTGSQNRFTALRQFRVLACTATATVTCTQPADFHVAYTSPANAFPATLPRPVAPTLTLRSFDIPPTTATHLRLEVVSSQCTGNPEYAGQQSADPAVPTDCASAAPISGQVRAAEFEAFAH
jgi:hypothetical protein